MFTNEKPQSALEFVEGRGGCVMPMLTAAAKGRTVVFSRITFGCEGAGIALGFDQQYSEGINTFYLRAMSSLLRQSFTKKHLN